MKQELRKLRGSTIATSVGDILLKQFTRLQHCQYDQMYFTTGQQFLLCKVYNLDSQTSLHRFERQKQIYSMQVYPTLASCIAKTQLNIKKNQYGFLIISNIPRNSSLKELGSSLSSFQLLKMTQAILKLIQQLKQKNEVYLNIKPENIFLDTEKQFCIINPEYICGKGKHSSLQESNQFLLQNIQKQFKYCSPQLLDNYSYFQVDQKADIFSLGCVLYQVIFAKYPFESKFANINIIYDIQEGFFGKLIEKMFKPYKQRWNVKELLQAVEQQLKKNPDQPKQTNTSSTYQSKTSKNAPSFFDDITSVFNKYTKESQGAYLNFTEDNENIPSSKHLSFILNKLYKNPSKVDKLQSIVLKHVKQTEKGTRRNFLLKSLILTFQILRKTRNHLINRWVDIINQVKQVCDNYEQLVELGNIMLKKIQLQNQLNCILRGNFCLEDVCQFKLLSIQNISNMVKYLQCLLIYSNKLIQVKDTGIFQYVLQFVCDQIYDLISMIILSVICLRKDNQLSLRKDNLEDLQPIDKRLGVFLKKINILSSRLSHHAIYSVQGDYYNYKQDIYINQKLEHTSFEYFIKYCKFYKGLALPQNCSYAYSSQSGVQYRSMDTADKIIDEKSKAKQYFYGNQISSDDEQSRPNSATIGQIHTPVQQLSYSEVSKNESDKFSNKPQMDVKNLFGNSLFDEPLKKVKSTDNQISMNIKKQEKIQVKNKKVGFDDFSTLFVGSPNIKEVNKAQNKKKPNQNKTMDPFSNFSFTSKPAVNSPNQNSQASNAKNAQLLNLLNFSSPNTKQKGSNKIDPNSLNDDIFSYQWLKKSQKNTVGLPPLGQIKPRPTQSIVQKHSPFVTQIIQALKLKQLKDLILKNKEIVIQFNKLIFDKVIGSGSAGQVYLGKYNDQPIAIKKVKIKQNPNALKQFQRQLVTYIKIKQNQFLVSLIGLSKSGQDFYLLTEFCTAGSLFDLLHKKAGQIFLSWKTKMSLILQCAKGIKALHDMRPAIIHRDLKSLNVFISQKDNKWIAKVADFGLSRSPQAQMMTMALGTLHWMAPQLLDGKQYSLKVDVYSFAIVMWEICARKTPYYQLSNPMAIMKYVTIQNKRPNMSIIDNNCPPKLFQLINRCWDQDPNKRPLFKQILSILEIIDSEVPDQ